MKKALILGGSGQDGLLMSLFLIKKKYKIVSISRHSIKKKYINLLSSKNYLHKKCDIRDSKKLFKIISNFKPNEIYNFAGVTTLEESDKKIIYNDNINNHSVVKIYDFLKKKKFKGKFFQSLSAEVFGDYNYNFKKNKYVFNPLNPYAISKLSSYYYANYYRRKYLLNIYCGFLFNHDSKYRQKSHIISVIKENFEKIKRKEITFFKLKNIAARRDWNSAKNFVHKIWSLLKNKKAFDFILCSGQYNTVEDVINIIAKNQGFLLKKKKDGEKIFFLDKNTNKIIIKAHSFYENTRANPHNIQYIKIKSKNKLKNLISEIAL